MIDDTIRSRIEAQVMDRWYADGATASLRRIIAREAVLEQLARDLLARLSQDYGDHEGELEREVAELFIRGNKLLPIE